MIRTNEWFYRKGELTRDGWESVVDERVQGWAHTGLRVADFGASGELELPAKSVERMVIPLSGGVSVRFSASALGTGSREHEEHLEGRDSVFDGPTDVMYLPTGVSAVLSGAGRVAVASAPATERKPASVMRKADVPVEIRGTGRATRQVNGFGMPGGIDAQKLIVCEVITPAANWSSYPAHKHDEMVPGHEVPLEEIYYFEAAAAFGSMVPSPAAPFGLFTSYSSPAGAIETNSMVRTGDIALVPFGYHGPAVAAPGYDLYYLNVMAGPSEERTWAVTDDPAQAWLRATWEHEAPDRRLPLRTPYRKP